MTTNNINIFKPRLTFLNLTVRINSKPELIIKIKDCRDTKNLAFLSELKIEKNGTDFITLNPRFEKRQILKNLELGTYRLIYNTIFNKEEAFTINITENKIYNFTICINYIDYSKETYKPIIDRLMENESYIIHFSSQGCFHSTKSKLTIQKTNDIYTITWDDQLKELSQDDIEALRQFEFELNYMTYGDCTTIDTYIIEYKGEKKQFDDGGCRWNGYLNLKWKIFGGY